MKIKKFQRGVAEIGVMVLSFLIICLGLSIMGVRNYYLLSNYKSETFKVIPEDVDLCSNINFYPLIWQLEHGKAGEEPQEISDMNILLGELQKKSGLDVKEDLLSWMEPEVSFGLFKVENFYRYMKAIRKLDKCKENISYIDFGLETYYEKHKSYPKELKELVPDYIEEIPSCPCEGRYEYKTEKENQVFLLECCENAHIEAGLSGRFPSYRGEKGENTEIACEKELPSGAIPEWILVAGVKDTAKAEAFLSKMTEKGQVKISSIDYKDNKINSVEKYMSFCFSGKFLIIASKEEIIKNSIDILKGEKENITKNILFAEFSEKKPEYCMSWLFVNLEGIFSTVARDIKSEPLSKILPSAIKAFRSYFITCSAAGRGLKIESYTTLDRNSDSPVIKILLDKEKKVMNSNSIIPDDTSMIFTSSDLKSGHEIGREFLKSFPEIEQKYESLRQMFTLFTQLDIDKDIIENMSGEIALSSTITEDYVTDLKKVTVVEKARKDVIDIGEAVLSYQKEHEGKLPEKLEELKPAYMAEIPVPPGEGTYILAPSDEKQTGEYPPFYIAFSGQLPGLEKDFPKYYSQSGSTLGKDEKGMEKIMPVPITDNIIIVGIKNKEPFKKLFDLATQFMPFPMKEFNYRGATYCNFGDINVTGSDFNMSCAFLGDYFIITTGKTMEPVEKVIDTFKGNRKSIAQMRDYKIALKEIGQENLSWFSFIRSADLLKISEILPGEEIKKENLDKVSDQFMYIWSSSRVEENGLHSVIFIPLN